MAAEIEIKHLDNRTVARYLARGAITQEQYDKYLSGLSDVADNSEKLEVIQPGEDFGDETETTSENE